MTKTLSKATYPCPHFDDLRAVSSVTKHLKLSKRDARPLIGGLTLSQLEFLESFLGGFAQVQHLIQCAMNLETGEDVDLDTLSGVFYCPTCPAWYTKSDSGMWYAIKPSPEPILLEPLEEHTK